MRTTGSSLGLQCLYIIILCLRIEVCRSEDISTRQITFCDKCQKFETENTTRIFAEGVFNRIKIRLPVEITKVFSASTAIMCNYHIPLRYYQYMFVIISYYLLEKTGVDFIAQLFFVVFLDVF